MTEEIARHKTAISRTELSRPFKAALADGILSPGRPILDYGCGLGDDLKLLNVLGIPGSGWDPVHRPETKRRPTAIVNIGYVVNVIENPEERRAALKDAWALTEGVLIVSARLNVEAHFSGATRDYSDGLITARGTFQKFFDQQELRNWIDQTLGAESIPAAPGVFYVFRDTQARSIFVASRYRRVLTAPRITRSAELFREYEALLKPLMDFVGERGRLPELDEAPDGGELQRVFGSVRRAFQVICSVTEKELWADITAKRREDLLIYLALARFGGRPKMAALSRALQGDIKGLTGSYKRGCDEADSLLYSLGRPGVMDAAAQSSKIGKLTPSALYVHESAVETLSPVLRLFEGCARGFLGKIEGGNIVKLHRDQPMVSYLSYPTFESEAHPALSFALTVHLQTFRVKTRDYRQQRNRPILHRKELFIASSHPLHSKFSRLTRIEEEKGLYADPSRIGYREEWERSLAASGLYFKGHRLLSSK